MDMKAVLSAIGYKEPSDFYEICRALSGTGDKPDSSKEWAAFFNLLHQAEQQGYVEVAWTGRVLDSAQLTEEGASYFKSL